jgi:hypothetical protein
MKRLTSAAGAVAFALAVGGCAQVESMLPGAGWTTLLDGTKGMENWERVGDANWREVDGVIQADKRTGKDAGFLVSRNNYSDFQVRVEFWASDDANSGIYMRCADRNKITDKSCYEANIFDQRPDPTYGTGAIVHIAPIKEMPKAGGKWNVYDITARGPKLTVVLNGQKTVEVEHSQFKSGPIALQYGSGVVKFRKVQVRPL